MSTIWNFLFYKPIYNLLILLINKVTFGDVGLAIVLLTVIVKLILFPLTRKSIKTQVVMKKMEPELAQIKKDYPDNKEEQARKTFELYKKYDTNPFSGFFVVLLQIPVIFALYYAFSKGLTSEVKPLYSFVEYPLVFKNNFLGLFDLHSKSIILALMTGLTQFIQGYLAMPIKPKTELNAQPNQPEVKTFSEELSSSMQMNVKYVLPIIITFISYRISSAVVLYWMVSNLFTIAQEWYVRRSLK